MIIRMTNGMEKRITIPMLTSYTYIILNGSHVQVRWFKYLTDDNSSVGIFSSLSLYKKSTCTQ